MQNPGTSPVWVRVVAVLRLQPRACNRVVFEVSTLPLVFAI